MSIEDEFLSEVIGTKIKPTKRKKGINSKQKGNSNERELTHILNKRFEGYTFARSVSSGAYTGGMNQSRAETLTEEQKLVFSGDIRVPVNFKFTIEHKAYAEASFWDLFNPGSDLFKWYEQSSIDAKNVGKEPLLIVKYNNHKRIAFIKMDYLIKHKAPPPVFVHENRGCYWLEDILCWGNDFFFDE